MRTIYRRDYNIKIIDPNFGSLDTDPISAHLRLSDKLAHKYLSDARKQLWKNIDYILTYSKDVFTQHVTHTIHLHPKDEKKGGMIFVFTGRNHDENVNHLLKYLMTHARFTHAKMLGLCDMHKFMIKKLVRDKVPYIIQQNEDTIDSSIKVIEDDQEFDALLRQKLCEEAHEFQAAQNTAELIEELADVMEVLNALRELHHIEDEDLTRAIQQKFEKKGVFKNRFYCEYVVAESDSELDKQYLNAGLSYTDEEDL